MMMPTTSPPRATRMGLALTKITSEWDTSGAGPAKRSYEVTAEGRELMKAWAEAISLNITTLKSFLERFDKLEP